MESVEWQRIRVTEETLSPARSVFFLPCRDSFVADAAWKMHDCEEVVLSRNRYVRAVADLVLKERSLLRDGNLRSATGPGDFGLVVEDETLAL